MSSVALSPLVLPHSDVCCVIRKCCCRSTKALPLLINAGNWSHQAASVQASSRHNLQTKDLLKTIKSFRLVRRVLAVQGAKQLAIIMCLQCHLSAWDRWKRLQMSARGITGLGPGKLHFCSSCHFLTPQDLSRRRWRFDNSSQPLLPHVSGAQQMAASSYHLAKGCCRPSKQMALAPLRDRPTHRRCWALAHDRRIAKSTHGAR